MARPLNPRLYAKARAEAKRRFERWPSAYASGWLVKRYKQLGGRYARSRGRSKTRSGVGRWFRERWINVCEYPKIVPCARSKSKQKFPYCRPLYRISKKTPKTVRELTLRARKELCRKKQKNPNKRMAAQKRMRSRKRSRSRKRTLSR